MNLKYLILIICFGINANNDVATLNNAIKKSDLETVKILLQERPFRKADLVGFIIIAQETSVSIRTEITLREVRKQLSPKSALYTMACILSGATGFGLIKSDSGAGILFITGSIGFLVAAIREDIKYMEKFKQKLEDSIEINKILNIKLSEY